MPDSRKVRVAVNGYGVIGKRVAAAVASQEDMALVVYPMRSIPDTKHVGPQGHLVRCREDAPDRP